MTATSTFLAVHGKGSLDWFSPHVGWAACLNVFFGGGSSPSLTRSLAMLYRCFFPFMWLNSMDKCVRDTEQTLHFASVGLR